MLLLEDVAVQYPSWDGEPMAESTLQYRWIVTIIENLCRMYDGRDDVFVAGDLLWYPVEGQPAINAAPDAMVVFGRPPGDRASYIQHEEDGIAPQVVFEIRSHTNTNAQMRKKREFYERYDVEEYYYYDPFSHVFEAWLREGEDLVQVSKPLPGFTSPLLDVRFDMAEELLITGPDGVVFVSPLEREKRIRDQVAENERRMLERMANQERQLEAMRKLLIEKGIQPPV